MLTRVVKLGGNELDRGEWLADCARTLAAVPGALVVVHGGGQAVSELSRRLGLPVERRGGLRVTTPEVAAVVEMVLAGPVNRLVVTALRQAGLDALGLSGADGGLLTAEPFAEAPGHVGRISAVRTALLESLLLAGLTPVIAPIAPAPGLPPAAAPVPLNVNADDAAGAIAAALCAHELLFVTDVPGVAVDGVAQPTLAVSEIDGLLQAGVASDGMAAKLRAAAAALAAGAHSVRIGDLGMLREPTAGTRILAATPQAA